MRKISTLNRMLFAIFDSAWLTVCALTVAAAIYGCIRQIGRQQFDWGVELIWIGLGALSGVILNIERWLANHRWLASTTAACLCAGFAAIVATLLSWDDEAKWALICLAAAVGATYRLWMRVADLF
jgi:hypothetical protein